MHMYMYTYTYVYMYMSAEGFRDLLRHSGLMRVTISTEDSRPVLGWTLHSLWQPLMVLLKSLPKGLETESKSHTAPKPYIEDPYTQGKKQSKHVKLIPTPQARWGLAKSRVKSEVCMRRVHCRGLTGSARV